MSVYLDITQDTVPEHFSKAINYCKSKRLSILIGIDSNAHSEFWGFASNKRGDDLLDYIMQEGLELHNKGKEYTYECATGKLTIDLTLKTGLKNWKVNTSLNHSDHNTIKYNLETESVSYTHLTLPTTPYV